MSFWWLQEGWTKTRCSVCGATIWPEGDPDWGMCYECFTEANRRQAKYPEPEPPAPEVTR